MPGQSAEIDALRPVFRSFKRAASRLRDGWETLGSSASLEFGMKGSSGEALEATFEETPALVRHAALLRPFMTDDGRIELHAVWQSLLSIDGLVDGPAAERIGELFAAAEKLPVAVVLNGTTLGARDICFAYGEGALFDRKPEAVELLGRLAIGPMVRFLFHSACAGYTDLVFALLDVILDIERRCPKSLSSQPRHCIYCLTEEGDFGAEEHVVPEAFGNDEIVLDSGVCKACNHELSRLDQFLAEWEPLAILRALYVPLTKKGKFPRASFREFELEKTKPTELVFTSKTGKDIFKEQRTTEAGIAFTIPTLCRTPLDGRRLARALFKIGLGLVAFDKGIEYACDARFNAARAFIRGHGAMPNHLLIVQHAEPGPSMTTHWQSFDAATGVVLDFFGVQCGFNLEPTPFGLPADAPLDLCIQVWLGEGAKDGPGGAPLCQAGCVHL